MNKPQTNKEETKDAESSKNRKDKVKQPPKAESKVEDKQPVEEQIAEQESQPEDEPKKESNDGLALGVILTITAIMVIASIPLFSMV